MYHGLCRNCAWKNITSRFQCTIKSIRNVRALLDYVNMTTYNKINRKPSRVTIIQFYILVWFHIQRHFCASISVRVSDSGHTVKQARKYITKKHCKKLHQYTTEQSTRHHTLLYNTTIQYTMTLFVAACHLSHKIFYKTKLLYYTLPHPHTLLIPPY